MLDFAVKAAGVTVFSKIDLRKGYHHIHVHPTAIPKMAIATPFGIIKYMRMPFGLWDSGSTFQRQMDRVRL